MLSGTYSELLTNGYRFTDASHAVNCKRNQKNEVHLDRNHRIPRANNCTFQAIPHKSPSPITKRNSTTNGRKKRKRSFQEIFETEQQFQGSFPKVRKQHITEQIVNKTMRHLNLKQIDPTATIATTANNTLSSVNGKRKRKRTWSEVEVEQSEQSEHCQFERCKDQTIISPFKKMKLSHPNYNPNYCNCNDYNTYKDCNDCNECNECDCNDSGELKGDLIDILNANRKLIHCSFPDNTVPDRLFARLINENRLFNGRIHLDAHSGALIKYKRPETVMKEMVSPNRKLIANKSFPVKRAARLHHSYSKYNQNTSETNDRSVSAENCKRMANAYYAQTKKKQKQSMDFMDCDSDSN